MDEVILNKSKNGQFGKLAIFSIETVKQPGRAFN